MHSSPTLELNASPAAVAGTFPITRIDSPSAIAKHITLKDESLDVTPAAYLNEGRAIRLQLASLQTLGVEMDSKTPNQVLTFGVFEHERCTVMSKARARLAKAGALPIVMRNAESMKWPPGAGVMFVDVDPPPDAPAIEPKALIALLRQILPALAGVTMLWRPSSGSYIFKADGTELRGLRGQHVYFVVSDASRIPAIMEVMQQRLWLAGHGYVKVTKSGSRLFATLVDAAVSKPEWLDFSCADCGPGLEQRMPAAQIFPGALDDIVGETALDPSNVDALTSDETDHVSQLQEGAKSDAEPAAIAAREAWLAERPDLDEAGKQRLRDAADGGSLSDDLQITLADGAVVTIAEIKANPAAFHGKECADPLEPDYRGDGRIALILTTNVAVPRIVSHAHGGVEYPLQSEEQRQAEVTSDFQVSDEPAAAPRFTPVSAHTFAAGKPPRWLVQHVLPEAELVVVYGESGSGKSFFVLDLVVAIALGLPWRGRRVRQGRVIYIAAEGAGGFRKRLRAVSEHRALDLSSLDFGVIGDCPNLMADDDEAIARGIAATGGASIVVVDTLAQTMAGGNENSGEDVGAVVKRLKRLHRATGALVLLVHHSGKDAARGARGWSGLRAAADAEMEIARAPTHRIARISKQKDGDDSDAFAFRLQTVNLGEDADGDPVTSCVVEHMVDGAPVLRQPSGAVQKVVYRVFETLLDVGAGPVPKEALIQHGVAALPEPGESKEDRRRESVQRALAQLHKDEFLVVEGETVAILAALPAHN